MKIIIELSEEDGEEIAELILDCFFGGTVK